VGGVESQGDVLLDGNCRPSSGPLLRLRARFGAASWGARGGSPYRGGCRGCSPPSRRLQALGP
jgi:hypothetical protein